VTRIAARFAVLAAGAVVMLAGALVLAFRPGTVSSFGWTAYAPRSDFAFVPSDGAALPVGLILVIAGFVAIVGWIAFEIGRLPRRGARPVAERRDPPPPTDT
jgi:heme/copper-type cytochrome/quinol oxidase subunit 1